MPKSKVRKKNDFNVNAVSRTPVKVKAGPSSVWFVVLFCGLMLLGLAWLMWRTGNDFASSGETTAQLRIPKYPFIYGMSVLCAVTGLVHVANAVSPPPQDDVEGGAL